MTDTTTALTRIRQLAQAGADDDASYDDSIRYEEILNIIEELETTMDTDTTGDAQWWWVKHHELHGWTVLISVDRSRFVVAQKSERNWWIHHARVFALRAEAEQAAVEAWREAGFSHAPQEPPGPKSVEAVWWRILRKDLALDHVDIWNPYPTREEAESRASLDCMDDDYRVVKVEATISEVEG